MRKTVLLVAAVASGAAQAQTAEDCAGLRDHVFSGGFVTSARVIPAADPLPDYCEVRATALPAISIEVRLPMSGWNGGLYQAGCGGFCGELGRDDRMADASGGWINAMRPGLARGYAAATSDSGHVGLLVTDASWAADPQKERDWGWRSIGETNRVAQEMIGAFYGAASDQAIFQGCSTGGRMAHMAAWKYPEMFDGIISGAPAMDYTGLVGTAMSYFIQANADENGEPILKPGKEALIGKAVMDACDALDGTEDGLIADPRECAADLGALRCEDEASEDCLSEAELDVIAKWRRGPVDAAGEPLYPGGIPAGSEPFWPLWLTGYENGGGKLVNAFADGFGDYMAFATDPGPDWSPLDFDLEADPARLSTMSDVYDSDNPDIAKFRAAGGKMIVWHGWADAIVTPYKTVEWFAAAAEAAGGEDALKQNVALFMIPGMDHCGILPGAGGLNQASIAPTAAMIDWLETGTPPTSIMAPKTTE